MPMASVIADRGYDVCIERPIAGRSMIFNILTGVSDEEKIPVALKVVQGVIEPSTTLSLSWLRPIYAALRSGPRAWSKGLAGNFRNLKAKKEKI